MEKLIYSIGEVADLLGESTSAVRFWCNSFPKEFNLKRNAKGDRQFRKADIEKLRQIRYLVKDSGMTLEGAAGRLEADRKGVDRTAKALESLRELRRELVAVKKELK